MHRWQTMRKLLKIRLFSGKKTLTRILDYNAAQLLEKISKLEAAIYLPEVRRTLLREKRFKTHTKLIQTQNFSFYQVNVFCSSFIVVFDLLPWLFYFFFWLVHTAFVIEKISVKMLFCINNLLIIIALLLFSILDVRSRLSIIEKKMI